MSDLVGLMRKVVAFKSNTPAAQGAGGKDNYSTLLTTRGFLKKSSGQQGLSFGETAENNSWKLIVRYQSALWSALDISLKCTIDSIDYAVSSWKKIDEDRGYIEIMLNSRNAI